jgi:hypothetical protein
MLKEHFPRNDFRRGDSPGPILVGNSQNQNDNDASDKDKAPFRIQNILKHSTALLK